MRITTALLMMVSLSLAGCDIGKNASHTELSGYDLISGYYATMPQSISFSATIGTTAERHRNGTVAQMPEFLKTVLANPTIIKFDDPVGGYGSIRSRADTSTGMGTTINDKLGTFGASTSAAADMSGCHLAQEITNSGTFNQVPSTVSGVDARGQLAMTYTLHYTLTGTDAACDVIRSRFKSCYVDGVNCSYDATSIFYPNFVYELFDPFVNSGTMTPDEIATFRDVHYEALYE